MGGSLLNRVVAVLFFLIIVCAATVSVEGRLKKVSTPPGDSSATTSATKSVSKDITRITPEGVEFVYVNPSAKSVFVAGNFNDWNSSRDALSKDKKGIWRLVLPLKQGHHQYKFVVDGAWVADPTNSNVTDDGFGGVNSVIEVKSSPAPAASKSKSMITQAVPGGVRFVYKNPSAKKVFVAGSFNSWNTQSDPLIKDGAAWVLIKKLPRGVYQYKFVVDGVWMHDPENPAVTEDGYGGKNSVIEVR